VKLTCRKQSLAYFINYSSNFVTDIDIGTYDNSDLCVLVQGGYVGKYYKQKQIKNITYNIPTSSVFSGSVTREGCRL